VCSNLRHLVVTDGSLAQYITWPGQVTSPAVHVTLLCPSQQTVHIWCVMP
jgi:hypothetical protein